MNMEGSGGGATTQEDAGSAATTTMATNKTKTNFVGGEISGSDWMDFYCGLKKHVEKGTPLQEFMVLEENEREQQQQQQQAAVSSSTDWGKSCLVAATAENLAKNRYGNILPFDKNRVKLTTKTKKCSDYVNASHIITSDLIPGMRRKIPYIAASAPLPTTIPAFYRMLWESNVYVVVMLSRNEEGGKIKCHKYWPSKQNKEGLRFGDMTVKIVNTVKMDYSFLIRTLLVQHGEEQREIYHFHYLDWPDHGVPHSTLQLERIIRLINEKYDSDAFPFSYSSPLVIHCSAGIGRTGTFVVVHTILDLLFGHTDADAFALGPTPPSFNIPLLVDHLRSQRASMVTQPEQYNFCYRAILGVVARRLGFGEDQRSSIALRYEEDEDSETGLFLQSLSGSNSDIEIRGESPETKVSNKTRRNRERNRRRRKRKLLMKRQQQQQRSFTNLFSAKLMKNNNGNNHYSTTCTSTKLSNGHRRSFSDLCE
ncbi:PTN6 phosphatase [Balamuthia mandrillaris]